jgi:hypothetical protein
MKANKRSGLRTKLEQYAKLGTRMKKKKSSKPDLDKIWADLPVTLTKQQAQVCRAIVSQDLMHTCELIGRNQDGSGNPLDEEGRYTLVRFSMETQLVLLGMTSQEIERIVRDFSQ